MSNITKEELKMLEACKDSFEWNEACSKIVSARSYERFPPDWKSVVVQSGLMDRIRSRWDDRAKQRIKRSESSISDIADNIANGKIEDD